MIIKFDKLVDIHYLPTLYSLNHNHRVDLIGFPNEVPELESKIIRSYGTIVEDPELPTHSINLGSCSQIRCYGDLNISTSLFDDTYKSIDRITLIDKIHGSTSMYPYKLIRLDSVLGMINSMGFIESITLLRKHGINCIIYSDDTLLGNGVHDLVINGDPIEYLLTINGFHRVDLINYEPIDVCIEPLYITLSKFYNDRFIIRKSSWI